MFVGAGVLPVTGSVVFEEHTTLSFEIHVVDEPVVELTVTLPEIAFGSIYTEGGAFATLTLPGGGYTTIVGEARLPISRQMLEIPYSSTPEITVTSVSWEYTSLNELGLPSRILPVQPSRPKIPGAVEEFCINDGYYETNTFLPADVVKVLEVGEIRGRRFALVECSPIQYNPSSGEIRILTTCKIRVDLPGSDMIKTAENYLRYKSSAFEDLFKIAFVNHGSYGNIIVNTPRDQEGYLIIVYDDFYDEIQPLADWKENLGFETTVTKTSDIPDGPTKENIHDYIEDAYNNWNTPPTYVLLVGDVSQIPTYTGQSSNTAADLYYVTINPEDYFPDIFIGRFPAAQESHVTAMIDKTVYYEQGDFPLNEWIKKAAFMAGVDNNWISEGTHNYVIENYLDPNNYTCDKLYMVTYGATTQDVKDALNDGRSLAIYSGHGGTTSWGDGPPFSQSDVNGLTNEDMYPFVCSHACLTGEFTVSECFGETWLRAPDKAGLAFWGSSTTTFWDEDDVLEKKMFLAWWEDNIETIGGMTDMALYYLYQHYGGGGFTKYYFECYNVLGDPSVKIWSDDPNSPPETPEQPEGATEGVTGIEYTFTTCTTDPEGEQIWYKFDWADNSFSDWIGPYNSGASGEGSHSWNEPGDYEIKAKAKDVNHRESDWSDPLTITILQAPLLEVGIIKGGLFGVSSVVRNDGAVEATNVQWSIKLEGGIIILGGESSGEVASIPAGEEATINSNLIIGFGQTRVTATAEIPESLDTREQGAQVFLFYIKVNPGGDM